MFSRDPRHNRPTPRSIQQAFGPYHRSNIVDIGRRRSDRFWALVSLAAVGGLFGFLFFMGWSM